MEDFVKVILDSKKFYNVMRCIKEIDKEHNGYVTTTELDDIFKLIYPNQFGDKDLKKIFKNFESISNTILIDYKKLRDFIMEEMKKNNKE